eukprot:Ihof_evm11s63 gene=Ihof_evmTU11s63
MGMEGTNVDLSGMISSELDATNALSLNLYVRYQGITRKCIYIGPLSMIGFKAWCLGMFGLFEEEIELKKEKEEREEEEDFFILYIEDCDRHDVSYELETFQDIYEGCVMDIVHTIPDKDAKGLSVTTKLDRLEDGMNLLFSTIRDNCDINDDFLETISSIESPFAGSFHDLRVTRRNDNINFSKTLSPSLARIWSHLRACSLEYFFDDIAGLRRIWKDMRYDVKVALSEWETNFVSVQNDITMCIITLEQKMSPSQHRRMTMNQELQSYLKDSKQLRAMLISVSIIIHELTKDVVIRRIKFLDPQLAHGADKVVEISTLSDMITQQFDRLNALASIVWREELQTVVKEEEYLKEQALQLKETQETIKDTTKIYSMLLGLVTVKDKLAPPTMKFLKESPVIVDRYPRALLLELSLVWGPDDSKKRLEAIEEMARWRSIMRSIAGPDSKKEAFCRRLIEVKSQLRHVADPLRRKSRRHRIGEHFYLSPLTPISSPFLLPPSRTSQRLSCPSTVASNPSPTLRSHSSFSFNPGPVYHTISEQGTTT